LQGPDIYKHNNRYNQRDKEILREDLKDGDLVKGKDIKYICRKKTPQGVIVFTSSKPLEYAEKVKIGIKSDKANPGINWKGIDAFGNWDPTLAIAEAGNKARTIVPFNITGFVLMSGDYIQKNPEQAEKFVKSFVEAYYYYAQNTKQANQWFADEARISFDPSLLNIAASVEQNLKVKRVNDVNVWIYNQTIIDAQELAQIAFDNNIINKVPDLKKAVDMSLLDRAMKELQS